MCGWKEQHKRRPGGRKCLENHKSTPEGHRNKGEGEWGSGLPARPQEFQLRPTAQAPAQGTCGAGPAPGALQTPPLPPHGHAVRWTGEKLETQEGQRMAAHYHTASRERWAGARAHAAPSARLVRNRGTLEPQAPESQRKPPPPPVPA